MIFKFIIIIISLYLLYFFIRKNFFKPEKLKNQEKTTAMIECNYCKLYITKEDSIKNQNLYFCSTECIKKNEENI